MTFKATMPCDCLTLQDFMIYLGIWERTPTTVAFQKNDPKTCLRFGVCLFGHIICLIKLRFDFDKTIE